MCHIGTFSQLGVKSGLKDIARVLEVPFDVSNGISKEIDKIIDVPPQPTFKDYDKLKDSDIQREKDEWEIFNNLEQNNKELFRIARNFEGLKRGFGVHASAHLVMPEDITNVFPTRVDKTGVTVTLYPGTLIEELGGVKLDLLGLKSLDIISDTLHRINKDYTFEDLYSMVDIDDPNIYAMLANGESDCVFQLSSNMFKNMLKNVKPTCLEDISAITSLGRPGPLSVGMDKDYAKAKNEDIKPPIYLRDIENITNSTLGVLAYQEQLMQISKQVCGFNASQSDSITRKLIAKKKIKMFPMLRRCLTYGKKNIEGPEGWEDNDNLPWYDPHEKYGEEISGAISNGYTKEEMEHFWESIQGFASYAFNASHACSYSMITVEMAWLKYYYPVEFFASVLSMETDEDEIKNDISIIKRLKINISVPDINLSESSFISIPKTRSIVYGLKCIKGVGETAIPQIIENRPYESLEDVFEKVPKKYFNKRVGTALIKSGAFDNICGTNRYEILNRFHEIREDKDYEILDPEEYTDDSSIKLEKETLGTNVSKETWIENHKVIRNEPAEIIELREITDKNNNLMCFIKLKIHDCIIDGVVFARPYFKYQSAFKNTTNMILVSGKKNNDSFIINKASIQS